MSEAKEFLKQVKKLDCMITNKLAERDQWKSIALGTSVQLSEKVQTSGSQQKMADAINKYIDIESEINECVDNLIAKKKEVISVIEQLPVDLYDILHKIYVQYYTFYDVADKKDISYSNVTTLHGKALKLVQKILDARK